MEKKSIVLSTAITNFSEEMRGYTKVRFVDWDPDVYLAYSIGSSSALPLRKGMKFLTSHDFFIYKYNREPVTVSVEMN